MKCRFLPWGLALASAACRSGPPSELSAEPLPGFPAVRAGPDCAPWDGSAVTILFATEFPAPDSVRPPYLRVSIWKDLESLAGHTWRWPVAETIGAASLCSSDDDCRAASKATIWIGPVGPDSAIAGRLQLDFPGQPSLAGSFRAAWRTQRGRCG